jgi:hypothetical protein
VTIAAYSKNACLPLAFAFSLLPFHLSLLLSSLLPFQQDLLSLFLLWIFIAVRAETLHTMSIQQAKRRWRGFNLDEQIEAALRDRLFKDSPGLIVILFIGNLL